ncbi:MAG TPA: hypothetical protein VIJ62_11740, partial [Rhizomicrobium sp.]
ELVNTKRGNECFRRNLLANVSAIALLGYAVGMQPASADDGDRPVVWVELGGQLERLDSAQTIFAPPFFAVAIPHVLAPMVDAQRQPSFGIGEQGKIAFEPEGSDWVVSASLRYGRSNGSKHLHYETDHKTHETIFGRTIIGTGHPLFRLGDGQVGSDESHMVLDFQAGKDVGLGLFGAQGKSIISAGVRFAQFTSRSDVNLHARPLYRSGPSYKASWFSAHAAYFQNNTAVLQAKRSTEAIGPMVSWDASVPVAGNGTHRSLTFDWGINAAILYGRQRARIHQQTTGASLYDYPLGNYPSKLSGYTNKPADQNRARNVTIPNVGGFAGVSFRYLNAKVRFGYRGDFFFNAMDNGIDTRKSSTVGFYGPFATISIGIGG